MQQFINRGNEVKKISHHFLFIYFSIAGAFYHSVGACCAKKIHTLEQTYQ